MNLQLSNGTLTASINYKGAELTSLQHNGKEYIWEGNPEFWGKHSPVLFPIVGTLKNNTYTYNSKQYQLSRHGFARDYDFTAKHKTDVSATFILSPSADTLKIYPFQFDFEIQYTLKEDKLCIDYKVINTGNDILPFSLGAHPAFALPGQFDRYSLKFEKDESLISYELENDLLSDKTTTLAVKNDVLPLTYELFKKDALIFKTLESKSIAITHEGKPVVKVEFENFPHLGLWTKDNAPFICIEPWQGYSDTTNSNGNILDKEGIITLEAGTTFTAALCIEIMG